MRRYGLHDDEWDRVKDLLPGRLAHVGVTAADNRLFVEAVLYRYRTGMRGGTCRSASETGRRFIRALPADSNSKSGAFSGFPNQRRSDSPLGWSFCHPFWLVCTRSARLFRTPGTGGAAISRWRISVWRPSPCFLCKARRFCRSSAALRKAKGGRTARPCSGSRKSPPTITSATCSIWPIRRCCDPVSSAWSTCSPSRPCARRSAGWAAEP